jgi:hypothetical protein
MGVAERAFPAQAVSVPYCTGIERPPLTPAPSSARLVDIAS